MYYTLYLVFMQPTNRIAVYTHVLGLLEGAGGNSEPHKNTPADKEIQT